MAIMNRSGYLKQTSAELNEALGRGPDFPENNINTNPTFEELNDPVAESNNRDFVKDPALQRLAIDTSNYPHSYSQLQAYMQGHGLTCIYFSKMNVNEGMRTNQVDSPYLKNVIHADWLRIDGFILNLTEAFSYDSDSEKATSEVTINGRTYPMAITPKTGDYFVTSIGDQKEGLFVVTKADPLSWRNNRAYQLSAYMVSTLTKEEWDVFNASVIQKMTFSKENYANGTQALLTSDVAQAQADLAKMRNVLASRYFRLFYSQDYDTLIRPDGYYDPYVVRFVNDQSDIDVTKYRARQLLYSVEDSYWKTLFSRLENNDSNDVDELYSKAIVVTRLNVTTDAFITALSGRGYFSVNYDDGDPSEGGTPYECRLPYICSQGFYQGSYQDMSEWERFLYDAIKTGKVTDFRTLHDVYLKTWKDLDPLERFYRIPIYIWLIDLCLNSITTATA